MQAVSQQESSSELEQKYISFSLGEEDYGLPVTQVLEIVRITELIRVPHALDYILGLVDIRGSVIPLINLKKKLGLHLEDREQKIDKAVIISSNTKKIGIAVDTVSHVYNLPPDKIDAGPATIRSSTNKHISGVGKVKNNFIILLNLQNLLTEEEISTIASY